MPTRRQVLAGLSAFSVLGFDPLARLWVDTAHASGPLDHVPALEGTLVTDPASLAPYATDVGNLIHRTPLAVLYPGSVADISAMIRFCARRGIRVAARGQGHTTFGQSQVSGGLIIDMGSLAEIHCVDTDSAEVDAGLKWNTLVQTTVPMGLTPPVLTGFLGLSVGGTLSVGGVSSTNARGAQVDRVRELEVVTGEGQLRRCSMQRDHDLFESVLAGIGQYGIITKAVIDLVPAHPMTRLYLLEYTDNARFFADFRTLLQRSEFDDVYNMWLPDGSGGWIYQLNATKNFEPGSPPNDAQLLRGLHVPLADAQIQDAPYLSYIQRVDAGIDFFKSIGLWDGVLHPWFDMFLPSHSVERYVGEVVPDLTPEDVGPVGFMLLFALKASKLRRPRLRVPASQDWVFLFDVLTTASTPGPDPDFASRMLARNRRLFEKARRVGGYRYPIGSLEFSKLDWALHYGATADDVLRAKLKYDPHKILTPGPGIF
jgi:FAD/FMN-containing dehydrogenase